MVHLKGQKMQTPEEYTLYLNLDPVEYDGFSEIDWDATKEANAKAGVSNDKSNFVIMKPKTNPKPQALVIQLGARRVHLSAEEIMDALEART